ncbi:MAG: cyclic nucleotide-binding domain-containing protein [Sphingomonadales bacterium]|nr:cyclic nucleotide-binding domain-containing protein [Sphingomonadales bacterium]
MPLDAREGLLRKTLTHSVAAGTVLFEQGELPTFQHVVLSGSAHLFGRSHEGREVLIEIVRPGDLVIPAAVVSQAPYLMQARVLEPSRFLLIEGDAFRAALAEEPALAQAMIDSLASQFRRMVGQIKNLKLRSAPQRVASYIVGLSRRQQAPVRVVLPYEKNLIASELGMTRESFSRTLSAMQRDGISVQGDVIVIVNRR